MNISKRIISNGCLGRSIFAIMAFAATGIFTTTLPAQTSEADKSDPRVARALKETGTTYEVASRDGIYRVVYETTGKRTQTALISSDVDKINDVEMRVVFSFARISKAAPTQPVANMLLQENMEKIGFWALQKLGDGSYAIVSLLHVPANASGKELEHAATSAALMADDLEERLTKKDVN